MVRVWYNKYNQQWRSGEGMNTRQHIGETTVRLLSSFALEAGLVTSAGIDVLPADVADANPPMSASDVNTISASFQQASLPASNDMNVDVDPAAVAHSWNLNPKQTVVYNLIIDQSLWTKPEPLNLIITGAAGTGKSRIVHTAQDLLLQKKQLYRFCLTSFTGIATRNIHGQTLHSALSLSALKGSQMPMTTREMLIQMWANVDFLFIDEYSMIGCRMLYKVHLALTIAKECSLPFSRINIIFAGDFCQLPAVSETRLYAKFGSSKQTTTENAHLHGIYGKLLWMSIRNIIVLQTVE